jgi:hypothetical protein
MKRFVAMMFGVSAAALLLIGCSEKKAQDIVVEPMKAETSHAFGFDIAGGDDVMPIAAYHGPYASNYSINGQSLPDYVTDEYWKAMADCGVNLMSHAITDYAYSPQTIEKNLDNFASLYLLSVSGDRFSAEQKAKYLERLSPEMSRTVAAKIIRAQIDTNN